MSTSPFNSDTAITMVTPAPAGTIQDHIVNFANAALSDVLLVAGIAAVFFLVLAGLRYITSGGDAEKARQARSSVVNVVVGIVVIVATFSIIRMASDFGYSILPS